MFKKQNILKTILKTKLNQNKINFKVTCRKVVRLGLLNQIRCIKLCSETKTLFPLQALLNKIFLLRFVW